VKRAKFIFLILFLPGYLMSQDYIDSLRLLGQVERRDSMFYEKLYDFTRKTCKVNPDTTHYFQKKYIHPTNDTTKFRGIGLNYLLMAIVEKDLGNYEQAIQCNQLALKYLKPIDYKVAVAAVYNNLGTVYKRKSLYDKALDVYLKSLEIKKDLNNREKLAPVYNNIGLLYFHLKEYDKAINYYQKSINISKEHGLILRLAKNYNNMGNVKIKLREPEEAMSYYKKGLQSLESEKNLLLKTTILLNLGISYQKLEQLNTAISFYNKAYRIASEISDANNMVKSLQNLGVVYNILDNNSKAKEYFNRAYRKAEKQGNIRVLMEISESLYSIYKSEGNYRQSLIYLEKHQGFKDSILNIEKVKEIDRLEAKYETKQKEQQIDLLEKQNRVKELKISKQREEKARKQLQALVLFGIAGLAIALAIFLAYQNKRKKRINRLLQEQYNQIEEQQEEIKTQNNKLSKSNEMKDQMFRIIAHDLRSPLIAMDDVARLIPYAIEEKDFDSLNDLSSSLQSSVSRILDLTDNLLSWSMSQSDEMTYNPKSISLYETGKQTLEIYFAIARMKQINLMNNIDTGIYAYADKNILMTVFRNLINNALKFTKEGGMVSLGARNENDKVTVWVRDTGVGMDEDRVQSIFDLEKTRSAGTNGETGNGLGLFFCKKFVQVNRGEIDIQSEKGKGTIVYFTLPKAESMVYG
jgi:signal transduction histidine kinase/Tfp pilus assembly protein PilF